MPVNQRYPRPKRLWPGQSLDQDFGIVPLPGAGTRVNNPDGSTSTERSITVGLDGKQYVIPSLIGGQQFTTDQAVQSAIGQGLQRFPSFTTPAGAESYASARSEQLGRFHANPYQKENIMPRFNLRPPSLLDENLRPRTQSATPARAQRPGFNRTLGPQEAFWQQLQGQTQASPLGFSGPQGPAPTPLGPPTQFSAPPPNFGANAFDRAASSQADLAAPGRGQFDFLSNVPRQFQTTAQPQPPAQAAVAPGATYPVAGTQGLYGTNTGAGGYAFGQARPLQGSVFSTNEGGFGITSVSRRSSLEGQGFGVSDDVTLPALPGGAPRLQPQDAALLGPETRAQLAFEQAQSPEGRADLAARGAASRANVGIRGIPEREPGSISPSDVLAGGLSGAARARKGRERTGTTRKRKRLGIPQEVRQQMVMNRAQGRRVPAWMAKIQVKLRKEQPLSAGENQLLQMQQISALPQKAQGRAFETMANIRHLMGVEERQSSPEAHQRQMNLTFAGQGQVMPQEPRAVQGSIIGRLPPELQQFATQYADDPVKLREVFRLHGNFRTLEDLDRAVEQITGKTGRPEPGWIKRNLGPLVAPRNQNLGVPRRTLSPQEAFGQQL